MRVERIPGEGLLRWLGGQRRFLLSDKLGSVCRSHMAGQD